MMKQYEDDYLVEYIFCKSHKTYMAKRQPQCACKSCWALYFWKIGYIHIDDVRILKGVKNISETK